MSDLVYVLLTLAVFVVLVLVAGALDRSSGGAQGPPGPAAHVPEGSDEGAL